MKKAPGILPSPKWLTSHGYHGLYSAMRKHPERFAHIRQRCRVWRTEHEWVAEAKRLAKQHGMLPEPAWLKNNGYEALYHALRTKPALFARIKQNRKCRHPEQWVPEAERLAKRRGKLPTAVWLAANGYRGLATVLRRQPGLFAHIKREQAPRRRTPRQWVLEAERLERKHGILPGPGWLRANGYQSLDAAMYLHPKLFAHVKQSKQKRPKKRSPQEWLPIAKRLAKKYGTVPRQKWLGANGYSGLTAIMRRHPGIFAGIPQPTRRKNKKIGERVTEAERLAKKHGMLPRPGWLMKNGHRGVVSAMRSHPRAFAHIRQVTRGEATMTKWVALAERLLKKHGMLPGAYWLEKNGYRRLNEMIREHAPAFARFPRPPRWSRDGVKP
jgi:hypothetical protein